jgi:hypothetical protein
MRNKMDPKGGKMRIGMASGSGEKMPMKRDKDGELRPAFVVDAEGKAVGGVAKQKVPKTKGYFKGGRTMQNKMDTKGGKMGGKG